MALQDSQSNDKRGKYKLTNWCAYNKSLEKRGSISMYISEDVEQSWYADSPAQRGGQFQYSDTCIETIPALVELCLTRNIETEQLQENCVFDS